MCGVGTSILLDRFGMPVYRWPHIITMLTVIYLVNGLLLESVVHFVPAINIWGMIWYAFTWPFWQG